MRTKNIKVINASSNHKCYKCSGTGQTNNCKCSICKGTGLWKEDFFHLIAEQPNGQKIAFGVDQEGK